MVKPKHLGIVEQVTFSIPVAEGEPWLFMIPKPAAERLRALAVRRGVSVEQILSEWVRADVERPLLSDEQIKSFRPKCISGCSHGLAPLARRKIKKLDGLLAFALSLGLLLESLYDYWQ